MAYLLIFLQLCGGSKAPKQGRGAAAWKGSCGAFLEAAFVQTEATLAAKHTFSSSGFLDGSGLFLVGGMG